jgi:hypothetical protein
MSEDITLRKKDLERTEQQRDYYFDLALKYREALRRIEDPEVLDAGWREMREIAREALGQDA